MEKKNKKLIFIIILGIGVIVLSLMFSTDYRPWESPEKSLEKFYTYGQDPKDAVAEDMLMDPLILAGKRVVPLVIQEARKKDMPKRGYAIAFLKNGGYKEALPFFMQILEDDCEDVLSRSNALKAMYVIDKKAAEAYIFKYQNRDDQIGKMARGLKDGNTKFTSTDSRSFWEAFWGIHH
jgi:hypothetical protein